MLELMIEGEGVGGQRFLERVVLVRLLRRRNIPRLS